MGYAVCFAVAASPVASSYNGFHYNDHYDDHHYSSNSNHGHNDDSTIGATSDYIPLPTDYASTVLFHHNIHRANHSATALTYSSDLAARATSLIQSCSAFADYNSANGYAFYTSSADDDSNASQQTAKAISTWYNNELEIYISDSNDMTEVPEYTGETFLHFSQLVWKRTAEVGCAATQCQPGTGFNPDAIWPVSWFVVCAYSPAGNCKGSGCDGQGFLPNVGAPLGMDYVGSEPWAI